MSGLIKRWSTKLTGYVKNIVEDYWTVVKETVVSARKRKFRAVGVLSGLGGVIYAIKSAPSEEDFRNITRESRLDLLSVSDRIRNPASESELESRTVLMNEGRLEYVNCIFLSFMLRTQYNRECNLFASQCKELQPKLKDLPDRIVDVGAFGHWFFAEKAMKDYDMNQKDLEAPQFAINFDFQS